MESLSTLVQPSAYHSLLLFHVGNKDAAGGDLENIRQDFTAWEVRVKGMGAQGMFSLILSVIGRA